MTRIPLDKRRARESWPDGRIYQHTYSDWFERSARRQRRLGNALVFLAVVAWLALLGWCVGRMG